jgi:hypothetical protein
VAGKTLLYHANREVQAAYLLECKYAKTAIGLAISLRGSRLHYVAYKYTTSKGILALGGAVPENVHKR